MSLHREIGEFMVPDDKTNNAMDSRHKLLSALRFFMKEHFYYSIADGNSRSVPSQKNLGALFKNLSGTFLHESKNISILTTLLFKVFTSQLCVVPLRK